ncbi:DUF5995 family protein [Echinicola jeungdonensis]|uniref:DUF5995 family protein n=1 Tax=Echinicola jeungdonensis TaxID=709343 RepID=A0ABV5J391_9BACT|nr:DUF5995 family protein [Echinicola jeungdonensis]MDN3670708.1 DUF5995 family protein [Echinicola jeungdonensis]
MKSIDQVISRMDEIVEECKSKKSRIGYFAVLYRRVTIRIREGIENGEFEDNPRMEKLDILFAQRFFDAYDNYINEDSTTESWLHAFDTSKSSGYLVLQHLLLGVNAHINLDLGIATVETMEGKNLIEIINDFDKINLILAELVDGVKANISKVSPVFGFLIQFANGKDEMLMEFSIRLARDGAWKFANLYFIAEDRALCLNERDERIANLASKIANPGTRLKWMVKLISWTEWKSIPKVMDQLEVIAQECAPNQL